MVFIDLNNGDLLICDAILFYDKYMIPFDSIQKNKKKKNDSI